MAGHVEKAEAGLKPWAFWLIEPSRSPFFAWAAPWAPVTVPSLDLGHSIKIPMIPGQLRVQEMREIEGGRRRGTQLAETFDPQHDLSNLWATWGENVRQWKRAMLLLHGMQHRQLESNVPLPTFANCSDGFRRIPSDHDAPFCAAILYLYDLRSWHTHRPWVPVLLQNIGSGPWGSGGLSVAVTWRPFERYQVLKPHHPADF